MLMTIRRKFNECDLNDSGTIERDELAGLLRAPDLEKYMVRAPQELTSPYVFRDGRGGQDPGRGSRGDNEVARAEAEAALQQAEQERTHPFSLTGHPIANYNGRYKVDRMHGESPALKNANGMYCYRHAATGSWFLNDEFTPDSELCYTCIESEGPLPVGANAWQNCVDDQLVEQELTTTVTEEFATELRLRAECLAAKREGGASVEPSDPFDHSSGMDSESGGELRDHHGCRCFEGSAARAPAARRSSVAGVDRVRHRYGPTFSSREFWVRGRSASKIARSGPSRGLRAAAGRLDVGRVASRAGRAARTGAFS